MDKKQEKTVDKVCFVYQCTACTGDAIETSNKMLGVEVECKNCKRVIVLDNENNYSQL